MSKETTQVFVQKGFSFILIWSSLVSAAFGQCLMLPNWETKSIENASDVFEGKVVAQSTFFDEFGNIKTSNTIDVYRVMKGDADFQIAVLTEGGILEDKMQIVTPSVKLKVGDYGLFVSNENQGNLVSQFYQIDEVTNHVYGTKVAHHREELYNEVAKTVGSSYIELKRLPQSQEVTSNKTVVQVASIYPQSATAGTQTLITISGQGFGGTQGTGHVAFRNANDGGQSFVILQPGPHYLSWSDTEIQLYVPSASLFNSTVAGTGNLEVRNGSGQVVNTNQELNIDYAKSEVVYNESLNATQLVAQQNGGYEFYQNLALAEFTDGTNQVEAAFEKWACNTSVNFKLKEELVNLAAWQNDGINLIGFSSPGQLPSTLLGKTITTFSGCGTINELQWNLVEVDILLNSDIDWYVGNATPPPGKFDLMTSILHELGHAHLLQHNNDETSPMYFELLSGSSRRFLNAIADVSGGNFVVTEATESSNCSEESHQPHDKSNCNLSLINSVEDELAAEFSVYPNPFADEIQIDLKTTGQNSISLFDQTGRLVLNSNSTQSTFRLKTNELPTGIYLLRAEIGQETFTTKLVKN